MGMNKVVLQELLERHDRLKPLEFVIRRAGESMIDCYRKEGKCWYAVTAAAVPMPIIS